MTAERFQQIQERGGLIHLSDRARFRLTGADRVRYLNGQVTNDVRMATTRETLYACVTDLKGRAVGDVFIHADDAEAALFLDAEPVLRDVLGPRLERYIISDDATLTDVTDDWDLWHFFGPAAVSSVPEGDSALRSDRLSSPGWDIWLPRGSSKPECDVPLLTPDEFENWRIFQGVPRFPNELGGETFPPEAGLDARAISYTKGCYIGQEILSRIRTTGKMPRRLFRCELESEDGAMGSGDSLFRQVEGSEAKKVGEVTSSAFNPVSRKWVGLAYLKSGIGSVDSELLVGGGEPRIGQQVKISPLVNQ